MLHLPLNLAMRTAFAYILPLTYVSSIGGERLKRFLECSPDDLKMSEVAALLQEYKRLAESIRSLGLFDETTA